MEERKSVEINQSLLRRGYSTPEKKYMNPDGTATSRVFKLRQQDNGELSVDVESLTTLEKALQDSDKYILFRLENKSVVEVGLQTYHAPLSDGSNDAHSVIVGMSIDDDILPGMLARASRRIFIY
jgi:hypothetical protein